MIKEQKLCTINEIKQIERKLYLKKSQLASQETMRHEIDKHNELDTKKLKQKILKLIEQIGILSTGGNSIEDVKRERQR